MALLLSRLIISRCFPVSVSHHAVRNVALFGYTMQLFSSRRTVPGWLTFLLVTRGREPAGGNSRAPVPRLIYPISRVYFKRADLRTRV